MIERRTEPRMLCADLVDVRWKAASGRSYRAVANLEDISLSGACVQLDEPVPVGSMMAISYPRGKFAGVVRYCHYREIGYFVGVQFDLGQKWTETSFRPMHLLDPRTVAKREATNAKSGVNA